MISFYQHQHVISTATVSSFSELAITTSTSVFHVNLRLTDKSAHMLFVSTDGYSALGGEGEE